MRIRSITPGFFKNEGISELPAMHRLLFIGLWCLADKEGRLEDRVKRIKIEIFPYDNYDAEKGLKELEKAGFILRYKVNANISDRILAPEQPVTEVALIQIRNFTKHQRISGKESQGKSLYLCPPENQSIPPPNNGEASGKQPGSNGEAPGCPGVRSTDIRINGQADPGSLPENLTPEEIRFPQGEKT